MQAPSDLVCPIAREVFEAPLLYSDGFTYEKSFITKWVGEHKLSPMLGCELPNSSLSENKTLFTFLNAYKGMRQRLVTTRLAVENKKTEEEKLPVRSKEKLEEILNHYYKSTLELTDCCKQMEALYDAHPDSFEVIMNLANVMRFSAQFDKSLSLIEKLREMRPNSLIPYYMRIRVVSESGNKNKANQLLTNLQSKYPIENHCLLEIRFMSYALLSLSNRDTAHKIVTAYLTLMPNDVRAISHYIYINLLLESYEYVIVASKEYLKKHPDDVSVMFHLAKAFVKTKEKSKAVEIYKRIYSIATDKAIRSKALYEAAVNRDSNIEFEEIVQELEESYRLDPREEADGYLAALYADKKMYSKAEEWIKEYEKRMDIKNDQVFLGIKAQILENSNRYEEAILSYIRLSEIDKVNGMYYNRRVEAILRKKLEETQ